ncbi:unnamed protein product [Chrysoparadoxa australica]
MRVWSEETQAYTGYRPEQLECVAKRMHELHYGIEGLRVRGIRQKYLKERNGRVALVTALNSSDLKF